MFAQAHMCPCGQTHLEKGSVAQLGCPLLLLAAALWRGRAAAAAAAPPAGRSGPDWCSTQRRQHPGRRGHAAGAAGGGGARQGVPAEEAVCFWPAAAAAGRRQQVKVHRQHRCLASKAVPSWQQQRRALCGGHQGSRLRAAQQQRLLGAASAGIAGCRQAAQGCQPHRDLHRATVEGAAAAAAGVWREG